MLLQIVNIILQGLCIGVVVSAPMGPVGVLCVQRTLNKGRWFGFVTGLGAAISDIIYALITATGISYVLDLIEEGQNMFYLQVLGSIMLFLFGTYTFCSNPVKKLRPHNPQKGTLVHNGFTAFLVTLSNPLIIFLFLGLFARFPFMESCNPGWMVLVGFLCIAAGAMAWWFGLTYSIDKVRNRFDERGIWMINRIIGAVVMAVSVISLLLTITGRTLY